MKAVQRAAGITFVFVTHDQTEALALSDEVIVMERGRVVQRATPATLYDRPATRYVAEFVGEATVLSGTIVERADDELTIETAIGRLKSGPLPLPPGNAVAAVIRPEAVRMAAGGAFSGTVTACTYRGSDMLADIMVGSQPIVASLVGGARHDTLVGDTVTFDIAPEAVWLVPDTPGTNLQTEEKA